MELLSALIYPANSSNLQEGWLQEYNAFFTATPTGWTNDDVGYQWLTTVFDRYSKPKAKREWRLLIVDGHGSHLTMRYLDWCEANKVLVAVFPPHSTHRLQPLDVSLFSLLATYYSQELDQWMHNCQGLMSLQKRHFWTFFWTAFNKAFTEKDINSG